MLEIQVSSFTNTSMFKYLSIIYHQLISVVYLHLSREDEDRKENGDVVKRCEKEQKVIPRSKHRSWSWCLGKQNCCHNCRISWGGSPSLGLRTAWLRPRRCGVWPWPRAVSGAPCRSLRDLPFLVPLSWPPSPFCVSGAFPWPFPPLPLRALPRVNFRVLSRGHSCGTSWFH